MLADLVTAVAVITFGCWAPTAAGNIVIGGANGCCGVKDLTGNVNGEQPTCTISAATTGTEVFESPRGDPGEAAIPLGASIGGTASACPIGELQCRPGDCDLPPRGDVPPGEAPRCRDKARGLSPRGEKRTWRHKADVTWSNRKDAAHPCEWLSSSGASSFKQSVIMNGLSHPVDPVSAFAQELPLGIS